MHHTDKYSQYSSIIWLIWLNVWVFVYELSGCGFESRCSHSNFRYCTCFRKEFLDIQAIIEFGFTLKHVTDMVRTYTWMHLADKYSQRSSVIWLVWLNGCVRSWTLWSWVRVLLQSHDWFLLLFLCTIDLGVKHSAGQLSSLFLSSMLLLFVVSAWSLFPFSLFLSLASSKFVDSSLYLFSS